jgi:hypothetical protein
MNFSFTYEEVTDLANFYVIEEKNNEKMELHLEPIDSGFRINIIKFKVSFITIKSKIDLKLESFDGKNLVVSIHFKNLFFELVKKVVFVVFLNLLKEKLMDQERDIDLSDHIHFGTSKIDIEINKIFELMKIPMHLHAVNDYRKQVDIKFTVMKYKKLLENEPQQISENVEDNIK